MTEPDYYEILQIDRSASNKDIKEAYRKLALQWHPDKCASKNDEIEQKFRTITKAYNVLSDEELREHYDKYGVKLDALADKYYDPFETFKLEDDDVPNVIVHVEVTTDELYVGITKTIDFSRYSPCSSCDGHGTQTKQTLPCTKCSGKGQILETIAGGVMGYMINQRKCELCAGIGIDPSAKLCSACEGIKYIKEEVSCDVDVPAGAYNKYVVTYKNDGNFIPQEDQSNGKERTDILFVITELKHPICKRGIFIEQTKRIDMADVLIEIELTFDESMCGFTKCVDYLNSTKITINNCEVVQNNDIFVMKHMGMPKLENSLVRGNLFIRFKVKKPVMTNKQKRKIWQILTNTPCSPTDYSNVQNNILFIDDWIASQT